MLIIAEVLGLGHIWGIKEFLVVERTTVHGRKKEELKIQVQ